MKLMSVQSQFLLSASDDVESFNTEKDTHREVIQTSAYPVTLPSKPERINVSDVGGGAHSNFRRSGIDMLWPQCLVKVSYYQELEKIHRTLDKMVTSGLE